MDIAVIGTGYVGLVSGTCFADAGNNVVCVDTNAEKINRLVSGDIPIFEPGLRELVKKNRARLSFTTDIKAALRKAEVCFIAVGTPMGEDGSADLHYVLEVAHSIGAAMNRDLIIIDKSTVPVGTSEKVSAAVSEELGRRESLLSFEVVSNPEFLREGSAIEDCRNPDRVIIGCGSERAERIMRELYSTFCSEDKLIFMDIASAEMTKYAANCMLATKISFINEIARICELCGADVNSVRRGIGSDSRIGYRFIDPGCGYGGSCFPKDVRALIKTADDLGYAPRILSAVEEVNADQKRYIPRKIAERFGEDLRGRKIAVWGLSFKPNTDDMRCAASIVIINELTSRGAEVHAYDPKASGEARSCYLKDNGAVTYFDEKYSACDGCDALVLVTEWEEFLAPDFERIKGLLKSPVIYDGRNIYSHCGLEDAGFEYYQIGVSRVKTDIVSRV